MSQEFPYICIPVLVKSNIKVFQIDLVNFKQKYTYEHLTHSRKRYNDFLDDVVNHPQLKFSECLHLFLLSENKKLFENNIKEYEKKEKNKIKFMRNMNKKSFDNLKNTNSPFENLKYFGNNLKIKISKTINNYFSQFKSKIISFENIFTDIETLGTDLMKCYNKVYF